MDYRGDETGREEKLFHLNNLNLRILHSLKGPPAALHVKIVNNYVA